MNRAIEHDAHWGGGRQADQSPELDQSLLLVAAGDVDSRLRSPTLDRRQVIIELADLALLELANRPEKKKPRA